MSELFDKLMESAGQGAVDAIFETWPDLSAAAHRAVVLCGPGNNGGDGLVVARKIHSAGGAVKGKIGKQEPENRKEKNIAPQSNGNEVGRRKRFHIRS